MTKDKNIESSSTKENPKIQTYYRQILPTYPRRNEQPFRGNFLIRVRSLAPFNGHPCFLQFNGIPSKPNGALDPNKRGFSTYLVKPVIWGSQISQV